MSRGLGVTVRRLAATDLAAAGALAEAAGYPAYRSERLRPVLASERSLGLGLGRPLQGFCVFELLPPEAELHFLVVDPTARGLGHGTHLLKEGLSRLESKGIARVFLEVSAANGSAQQLYRSLGFERVGVRSRYYDDGSDAWVYRWER